MGSMGGIRGPRPLSLFGDNYSHPIVSAGDNEVVNTLEVVIDCRYSRHRRMCFSIRQLLRKMFLVFLSPRLFESGDFEFFFSLSDSLCHRYSPMFH